MESYSWCSAFSVMSILMHLMLMGMSISSIVLTAIYHLVIATGGGITVNNFTQMFLTGTFSFITMLGYLMVLIMLIIVFYALKFARLELELTRAHVSMHLKIFVPLVCLCILPWLRQIFCLPLRLARRLCHMEF